MPIAFPFPSDPGGEDVEALDRAILGTFERVERAERAIDRILLVSESRGAEVGPRFLGVASLEVDPETIGDNTLLLECVLPFVYGSEGEDDAAEAGERSSGVEERVLLSPNTSPDRRTASTCGVDICEVIGVDCLLYTGDFLKALWTGKFCGMAWRRKVS